MSRKAADKMRAHPITSTALVGGGSILGLVGVLKSLSKPEQEAVIDAAIMAEQEEDDATAYGLSSASLLSAAVVMGMMDEDDEILGRAMNTSDSRSSATKRIQAPAPDNVIIRRR